MTARLNVSCTLESTPETVVSHPACFEPLQMLATVFHNVDLSMASSQSSVNDFCYLPATSYNNAVCHGERMMLVPECNPSGIEVDMSNISNTEKRDWIKLKSLLSEKRLQNAIVKYPHKNGQSEVFYFRSMVFVQG